MSYNVKTIKAPLKGLLWEQGALVTYTIYEHREQNYIYFDLHAGNVNITPLSYSGYVYVNGVATAVSKSWTVDKQSENDYHYYVYQSTNANKTQTGYASSLSDVCRLPSYEPVKVGDQFWNDYVTNNDNVEDVIEAWDTAANITTDTANGIVPTTADGAVRKVGRSSTPYFITVAGNSARNTLKCEMTLDNIYSRRQERSTGRTTGGITFLPNAAGSNLTLNLEGDNRVGCVHYYSGKNGAGNLIYDNTIVFRGSGSLTCACVDFYKSVSSQSSSSSYQADNVKSYFSNYWCSAIGGNDGAEGNAIGIIVRSGTIYAGTTQAENCTAIGGGGNDRGYVTIEGGTVTAVATTTGTAIGGGIGFNSMGGVGNVTISGGNVFAYNHANEWEIPSAAIGSAGSWESNGGSGTVTITGGYVYAQTALGTAIGGGSSKKRQGGGATVTISNNSYVIAKSIPALDNYTGDIYPAGSGIGGGTGGVAMATDNTTPAYGGSATINITGNPTIRTGTIGGGKTNNPAGKIGHAKITINGGDISAQFVMAGGAVSGNFTTFDMSGGTISNSYADSKEYYHAKDNGAAVYMEDGVFTMVGGTIRGCRANMGGAVYIKKSADALQTPQFKMQGGLIEGCESTSHGGAVYLEGGSVDMQGGVIRNNLASNGNGGGIYIAAGDFTMSGATASVSNNSALHRGATDSGNGGGIYITSPDTAVNVTVESGSIMSNTCDCNGGGICVDMSASVGDDDPKAVVKIGNAGEGPMISANKAILYGGGLYAIGKNAEITIDGGGIKDNSVTNYVTNEDVANEGGTVVLNAGEVTHVVVTFDVNTTDASATVSPATQNIVTSTNSFLVAPTPSRALYHFDGWNSRPDGKGVSYTTGDLMNISADMTLYAQWIAQ